MKKINDKNYYTEQEVRRLIDDFKIDLLERINHTRDLYKNFLFEENSLFKYCKQEGIFQRLSLARKNITLKLRKTNFNLFYEKKEVIKMLGISSRRLDYLKKNNIIDLNKYKLSNGRCFFLKFEVDAFVYKEIEA
jgi:hypothetical protein